MDAHFEREFVPPLPPLTAEWKNWFGDDVVNPRIDTLGLDSASWMGSNLGLDFTFSAPDAAQPQGFDFGLLDTVPVDWNLLGDQSFEHGLNGPQCSTSAPNNPYAVHEPLGSSQPTRVGPSDHRALIAAPIEHGQLNALGNGAFSSSNPSQEQLEGSLTNSSN